MTGLRRCVLVLVLVCATAFARSAYPNANTPGGVPPKGSQAIEALLKKDVGSAPGDSFQWVHALSVLGWDKEARNLQRFLLQAWMAKVNDQPGNGMTPLEQAIAPAALVNDATLRASAKTHFTPAINRKLTAVWAATSVPLPDEIDNIKDSLTEECPGFWSYRQHTGQLRGVFLWLGLQNNTSSTSPMPLVLLDFTLRLGDPDRDAGLLLNCQYPRTAKPELIQPQQTTYYLCRSPMPPQLVKGQTLAGVLNVARQQQHIHLEPSDVVDDSRQATLVALLAAPHQAELQAFLVANQGCKQRGNCRDVTDADRKATAASPMLPKAFTTKAKPWIDTGIILVKVAVLTMIYVVIARWAGLGKAMFLFFAGCAIFAYPILKSLLDATNQTRDWSTWAALIAIPVVVLFPFVATAFTAGLYKYFYARDTPHRMNSWMRALTAWGLMLATAVMIKWLTS
jgi:hypothetical protein